MESPASPATHNRPRYRYRRSAWALVLVLTSPLLAQRDAGDGAPAAPGPAPARDRGIATAAASLFEADTLAELVGERRSRDLFAVRFDLSLRPSTSSWGLPAPSEQQERLEEVTRSCLLKAARELLERRLDLRSRVPAPSATSLLATGAGRRIRLSPRLGVGSRPYLGLRARLASESHRRLDRLSLQVEHRFLEEGLSLALAYEDGRRAVVLSHAREVRGGGDAVAGWVRWSF